MSGNTIIAKLLRLKQVLRQRKQLAEERDHLKDEVHRLGAELLELQRGWPPGHFYSPIPAINEVRLKEAQIFGNLSRQIPGIDLNEDGQVRLLETLARYYGDQPFTHEKQEGLRFFFSNPNYTYGEALILYCLIRHLRPRRIIEIGSGYSSAAILDTNERFFDNAIACTFVEPYPELLVSLLKDGDQDRIEIVQANLQDVDTDRFARLSSGDILFVDSSHVSKVDSDVNHIFFRVLPHIGTGVYVHFHDIGYPFEYPKEWIYEGRAWNEAYLLRAFLQYNSAFTIELFSSFLGLYHQDTLEAHLPLCVKNPGTSMWIRKLAT